MIDINKQYTEVQEVIDILQGLKEPNSRANWVIANYLQIIPPHKVLEIGWDYNWYRSPDSTWLTKAIDSEGRQIKSWSPPEFTRMIDVVRLFIRKYHPELCPAVSQNAHHGYWTGAINFAGEEGMESYVQTHETEGAIALMMAYLLSPYCKPGSYNEVE